MKWFWWYFIVVIGIVLAGRVYLHQGFPYTHDGENHLARFANYKIAVREGQLPPRFAPNLQNRYGYPVFNYNYPLANILSLPFSFLHLNYETAFKFIALLGIALLALSVQEWVRLLGLGRVGQLVAVVSVASSPVLLNMTFFRGNIGEILGLALTATLLWQIERSIQNRSWVHPWLVLSWVALLLAHNITAVYATLICLGYAFIRGKQLNVFAKTLQSVLRSLSVALLATLWFWLPALAEKHLIVLDQAGSIQEYARHFATLSQLILSPVRFGFSYPGSIDTLSFNIGVVAWGSLLIAVAAMLVSLLSRKNLALTSGVSALKLPHWFGWILFASLCLLFIQTSASQWLWQLLKPLQYAQFPWRFGLFVVLLLAPVVGWLFEQKNWPWILRGMLLIFLVVQVRTAVNLEAVDYFHRAIIDYDAFTQTTSTQNENRTPAFQFEAVPDWQPTATLLTGEGVVTTNFWRGSERSYSVTAVSSVTVVEPTMVFAGWLTTANGKPVRYLANEQTFGRLAYQLEPGNYEIRSRFTQWTWPRVVGNGVSLFTIAWFCWQIIRQSRPRQHAK